MELYSCPGCGHKGTKGLSHSYFTVKTCGNCENQYCFKCPGSNSGNKCPKCASTKVSKTDTVREA